MATEAARLDPERRDLAREFPGGEMGRKGMRWEEGEAGASGMGWCLRAPGVRPGLPPLPTCAWCLPAEGHGLTQAGRKRLLLLEQWSSLDFSPVQLPLLFSPSAKLWGLLGEQRPCCLPGQETGLVLGGQCSTQVPYLDPGSSQACSEALRAPLLVWTGDRRHQCHPLKQASPGHSTSGCPTLLSSITAPSSLPPWAYHNV